MSIPKVIYQVFIGFNPDVHFIVQDKIRKMFQYNPHYEHVFVTEEEQMVNFIKKNYDNYYLTCYEKLKNLGSKIDFFKYLILYKNGGIYLDISMHTIDDLDLIVKNYSTISVSNKSYSDSILIFSENHPILNMVISLMIKYISMNAYPGDDENISGNKLFAKAVRISHFIEYNRNINIDDINNLTELYFRNKKMRYKIVGDRFNGFFYT